MKAHGLASRIIAVLAAHAMAAPDLAQPLQTDRAAVERVYHEHRTGTKPPFEQAMPAVVVEKLVRADAKKEAVLERVYGVKITGAMVEAEVQRIITTTRAPEVLAEIKAALGDDSERFARTMARPLVVERLLREKFQNDDALHASQRREAGQARERLLAKQTVPETHDVTWQLTPRPASEQAELEQRNPPAATAPVKSAAKSGSYSVEATAQLAQVLSSPDQSAGGKDEKHYFEDLDPQLQNVLRAQLRQPGEVSAVIETPGAFQIYLARARTEKSLSAVVFTLCKRSYEDWLAEQPEP